MFSNGASMVEDYDALTKVGGPTIIIDSEVRHLGQAAGRMPDAGARDTGRRAAGAVAAWAKAPPTGESRAGVEFS